MGLTLDGVNGVSPITYARETIGLSLAQESHGASTFKNGAKVSGVLKHPGKQPGIGDAAVGPVEVAEQHDGVARKDGSLELDGLGHANELHHPAESTSVVAQRLDVDIEHRDVAPEVWQVIRTFGIDHRGESGGSGSGVVTSRPAPAMARTLSRMRSLAGVSALPARTLRTSSVLKPS